jgi:hypothetical protein
VIAQTEKPIYRGDAEPQRTALGMRIADRDHQEKERLFLIVLFSAPWTMASLKAVLCEPLRLSVPLCGLLAVFPDPAVYFAASIFSASTRSACVTPPASCVDNEIVTLVYRMSMSGW